MKFTLTDYQLGAVHDTTAAVQEAVARFDKAGKVSAISLSAPTGAGKTVIATALIERMLYGDHDIEPNPQLTVLWVTDDPSLNQQTRRKMLLASSLLKPDDLVVVDPTLDKQQLDAGKVYFVHIQQLGKGATNYVRTGDRRKHSLWDTIGNTAAARGGNFLLIIDEAHRGTSSTTKNGAGKTITAQLVDGAPGGKLPPAPIVLGISATPTKFVAAISAAGQRTLEPVGVDPAMVRESGLLKDKIRIRHPKEKQAADSTLLELAVADLKNFDELWQKYSAEQNEPPVSPALVIQVKAKVSDNELKETLDTLAEAWDVLDGKAVAHAFQEHTTLNLGPRSIRYIAPQDIQDDPHLRAVLFKEALTTGWDCPRAEVMVSLRVAQDHTYIAQLIGRMVRTPLARRIATDEVLNTVSLFLPHFDEKHVAEVIAGLVSDESNILSRFEIDSVTCIRNKAVPDQVWDMLNDTPTYTRPARNHRDEVARLNALALLLVANDLDPKAHVTARKHLIDTLNREAKRLGAAVDAKVADLEQLDYLTQDVDLRHGGDVAAETSSVAVNARNIDDIFRGARRRLGDAAAKWYWDHLCDEGGDPDIAKLRVAALADDPTVAPAVQGAAKSLIDTWRNNHNSAINNLPDAKRAAFYTIWQQAKAPQQVTMIMPTQITAPDRGTRLKRHLYLNGRNSFPAAYTGWEAEVLQLELAPGGSLVAWYRNPTGGTGALAVPYELSGTARTLYPDFLFFHEVDGDIVMDVVDPHRPDQADTGPKWTGLARYAVTHGHHFRRVLAVIKNKDDVLVSLDLKNPEVAKRVEKATNETDIRKLFEDFGGPY